MSPIVPTINAHFVTVKLHCYNFFTKRKKNKKKTIIIEPALLNDIEFWHAALVGAACQKWPFHPLPIPPSNYRKDILNLLYNTV